MSRERTPIEAIRFRWFRIRHEWLTIKTICPPLHALRWMLFWRRTESCVHQFNDNGVCTRCDEIVQCPLDHSSGRCICHHGMVRLARTYRTHRCR